MNSVKSFAVILAISTIHIVYGLIEKKGWLYEPEKNLDSILGWQGLLSVPFRYFFGKKGVVVFNLSFLITLWGVVIYFLIYGK